VVPPEGLDDDRAAHRAREPQRALLDPGWFKEKLAAAGNLRRWSSIIRGYVFSSFLASVLKKALEGRIAALGLPRLSPIWIR
jgi:hypothetical protein